MCVCVCACVCVCVWRRLEEALLDMEPDEALEMAKKRRVMHVSRLSRLLHA
jgi:sensor histidine kinase regulating citrate/malate metabolism